MSRHLLLLAVTLLAAFVLRGRTVHDLASLKADLGYTPPKSTEFDLQIKVISACTKQNKTFIASDGTNSLALVDSTHWPRLAFSDNYLLHVKGRIREKGNPDCLSIEVLGKGPAEPVITATVAEILQGKHDLQLVEVHGTIRNAFQDEIDPEWAFITLYDGDKAIQIELMSSESEFRSLPNLIDCEVSVRGVARSPHLANSQNRTYNPTSLTIRSLADIQVLHRPPEDPFSAPPINRSTPSDFLQNERRSAVGSVLAVYSGNRLLLKTADNQIVNVELNGRDQPPPGMLVKAAGHQATDLYRINLTDAIWRKESDRRNPPDEATDVSLSDLLTDGHGHLKIKPSFHGRAIRLRGIVRSLTNTGLSGSRFLVESDQSMIAVDFAQCPDVRNGLEPNCEVEVSGICVMPTDNWRPNMSMPRIREVFLALRSSDDLVILRRPPWWTPTRFLCLIALLLFTMAGMFYWNRSRKQKIERQNRKLKLEVEERSRELLNEQIAHVTADLKTMERTRLAIELHDALSQNLAGVALQLQTAKETIGEDAASAAVHLEAANRALLSSREELRNCLRDLRSDALEAKDINTAIRLTLDPHVENARISIRFNVPRDLVTDNTLHAVLRIIRELVLNAIRHGRATDIKVAGAIECGKLLFSVTDNGCGFDPDNRPGPREGHFGLQGIRERVRGFEGELRTVSSPGRGAKITIALKLPKEDAACRE